MEIREENSLSVIENGIFQRSENVEKSTDQKVNTSPETQQTEIIQQEANIERSKYVYELVNGWIANADNKVSISCGVFTGIFGIFTFLTDWYVKDPSESVINDCWHSIYQLSSILSFVVMVCAVIFYAKAIMPNLNSSGNEKATQKQYPLFFGDIYSLKQEDYQELMAKESGKSFNDELIVETWFNAGICLDKMKNYKRGLIISLVAIGLATFSFIAHLLMYM